MRGIFPFRHDVELLPPPLVSEKVKFTFKSGLESWLGLGLLDSPPKTVLLTFSVLDPSETTFSFPELPEYMRPIPSVNAVTVYSSN